MFSIKYSLKYAWEKFKANLQLILLTTLFMFIIGMIGDKLQKDTFIFGILLIAFSLVIRIGYTKIFLRINDGESPIFTDIFKEYKAFWRYLGVSILMGISIVGGLILLIIPGIIWAVRFSFAPIIVVDTKSGPIASMKESYAITEGYFWKLFQFWLVIILINLAGIIALGVGLFVSVPVSTLAAIYVYRELTKAKASLSTAPVEPTTVSST